MIFTIEPMINLGNYETKILNDGWTAVTKDKSLSAQFEHTIGVTKNGWHGDTSRMFKIGEISIKAKKLIDTTYESMMKAIKIVKEGIHLGDIGSTIQSHVEAQGFSVVQDFVVTE